MPRERGHVGGGNRDWWDPHRRNPRRGAIWTEDSWFGKPDPDSFWGMIEAWPEINADDYMQDISPEMQQMAHEGYGQGWIRNVLATSLDQASAQKAQQMSQLGTMEAVSGLQSGFHERARDLTQYNYDMQRILTESGLIDQNEQVRQGMSEQIAEIEDYNRMTTDQIDLYNRMSEFERRRLADVWKYSFEEAAAEEELADRKTQADIGIGIGKLIFGNLFGNLFGDRSGTAGGGPVGGM